MTSDRIFGLVSLMIALAYVASATQIQSSFLADPVGPRAFPILIGCVAALCSLFMIIKPDPDPDWPVAKTFGALAIAVIVLVAYAYTLKPFGFIFPTMITAGILSYQISPNAKTAVFSGVTLSIGLFVIFKFILGLGLIAFPAGMVG